MSDTDYGKIQTFFARNAATDYKTVIEGQYATPEFAALAFNDWDFTEKVDGTNIRVMVSPDGKIEFGGHHANSQVPTSLMNRLVKTFTLDALASVVDFGKLKSDGSILTIYGEGYGAGIQKGGGLYRKDQGIILFDVRVGDVWLQRASVETIAQGLKLPIVPLLAVGTMWEAVAMVKQGFPSQCSYEARAAEGLVCRPHLELRNRLGNRIITKLKTQDFKNAVA